MANPKRQRAKVRLSLAEHLIPEQGEFGEIWVAKDSGAVYLCARNGLTFCLNDVLDGTIAHTPPRHGKDGAAGKDGVCLCRQGLNGKDGKDGRDGKDADICVVGDKELHAAVLKLKAEKTRFLAALQVQTERNAGRKHRGLQQAISNVLESIKKDAEIVS